MEQKSERQIFDGLGGNRYQIKSLLSQQKGRRTFLAQDLQTQQPVVVKLVLFGPDFTWQDLKLFEREAQTLQSLQHPAIPKYLDSFEVDTPLGKGFALVQTYIEARSLQAWVSSGYTFSEAELRAIAAGLLDILKFLHQRQPPVVHRDIKPSNILIPTVDSVTSGGVYLIDFGSVQTAPSTDTMTVVGTYGYMPPEQFGGRAKPASDLYSLGATLIYLSSGQHPAELTNDSLQIQFEPPANLSPNFAQWIQQLTQTNLSKRIQSAAEAIEQLNRPQTLLAAANSTVVKRTDRSGNFSGNHLSQSALVSSESSLAFQSAHKDFKVFSSRDEMEVQFSSRRLTEQQSEEGCGSCLLFIGKAILFLIGLSIGGGLFLIGFAMWAVASSSGKKQKAVEGDLKTAYLKLKVAERGETMMRWFTRAYESGRVDEKHIVYAPLATMRQDLSSGQVSFEYGQTTNTLGKGKIVVYGSTEDIDWLCKTISQWDNADKSGADEKRDARKL